MKEFKLNIFKIIRENETVWDERLSSEYAHVQSYLFAFLRVLLIGVVVLDVLNLSNIAFNILYYAFFVVLWLEPLLFSIRGLWSKVNEGIMRVLSGCIFATVITMKLLSTVIHPQNKMQIICILITGIISAIGSYILYTITYIHYMKSQEIE